MGWDERVQSPDGVGRSGLASSDTHSPVYPDRSRCPAAPPRSYADCLIPWPGIIVQPDKNPIANANAENLTIFSS